MKRIGQEFDFLYFLIFLGGCFFNPPPEAVQLTPPKSKSVKVAAGKQLMITIEKKSTHLLYWLPGGGRKDTTVHSIAGLEAALDEMLAATGDRAQTIYLESAVDLPYDRFQQTVTTLRKKGITKFSLITTK